MFSFKLFMKRIKGAIIPAFSRWIPDQMPVFPQRILGKIINIKSPLPLSDRSTNKLNSIQFGGYSYFLFPRQITSLILRHGEPISSLEDFKKLHCVTKRILLSYLRILNSEVNCFFRALRIVAV